MWHLGRRRRCGETPTYRRIRCMRVNWITQTTARTALQIYISLSAPLVQAAHAGRLSQLSSLPLVRHLVATQHREQVGATGPPVPQLAPPASETGPRQGVMFESLPVQLPLKLIALPCRIVDSGEQLGNETHTPVDHGLEPRGVRVQIRHLHHLLATLELLCARLPLVGAEPLLGEFGAQSFSLGDGVAMFGVEVVRLSRLGMGAPSRATIVLS